MNVVGCENMNTCIQILINRKVREQYGLTPANVTKLAIDNYIVYNDEYIV